MLKQWFAVLLCFCTCCAVHAQQDSNVRNLLWFTQHSDSIVSVNGTEKIYVQFDKPNYVLGDTIWLKAYLFNSPTYLLSARGGLIHIDIANDSDKIVKQYLLPVASGLSWGNIALDDKIFKPGDYTLRAYTNWMRNFPEEGFFYKRIRIAGPNENVWLVNNRIINDSTAIKAHLQLTGTDKRPLADSVLQAELTDGRKVVSRQNVQTGRNGELDLSFLSQNKVGKLGIVLQNRVKTKKAIIPVSLNRPENTDLQFMPEGGSLIAGFPARVGFKAIGEDGRGVAVSGVIVDHKDSTVASFKTQHKGIGSFYLQPHAGESYTARIMLKGGKIKSYALPNVKASGTLLQVKNIPNTDSLEVAVGATPDMAGMPYYLIAKARGITCYAAVADLDKEHFKRSLIAKNRFPQGIVHLILMNTAGQPLNERLVYIDHGDSLHIDVLPDQQVYYPKDSVALHLSVTGNSGKPVTGNFSMAVTDDNQVHTDSLDNDNIITHMLLTSELKGYVEESGYYFRNTDTAKLALDNLLLTQGWVNYEPTANMPFSAEKEFTVQGIVNNLFRAPVKKTHVVLFSRSPGLLFDTVTNNEGRFIFDRFPRVDTPVFVLKAVNRAGKSFNVNIDVDQQTTPAFNPPKYPITMPWYVNTDTMLMNQVKNSIQIRQTAIPGGGRLLKEVQIKAKKVVKGSYNLNGPGNADIVLDEKDLEEAGKKTWLQLFEENIKGFREGTFRTPSPRRFTPEDYEAILKFETSIRNNPVGTTESEWYFIYDKPVILIIDGVDIEDIYPPPFNFSAFMGYLRTHSAEDIKGIEVNFSAKYNSHYLRSGKWMDEPLPEFMVRDYTFVEVTTRSGHGAMIKYTPGIYLYKPLAISWPKQFYKPKYAVKDTIRQADLRSTVDWEPNITTDSAGHATVSFYAAGNPSTYTVIMEGTDLKGNVAYRRRKIKIVAAKGNEKSK